MRHGKRFNHLGRTAAHRKAMLSNMASSLILHKRITTTVAKAKALRQYVEPLLTKSKTDTTHSRRVVFSYLQNKESVKELFDEVSDKIAARPGGYTRIIKMGNRLGDNAELAIIELVDYNELLLEEKEPKKARTRRGRRRKKSSSETSEAQSPVAEEQKGKKEGDVKEEEKQEGKTDEKVKAEAVKDEAKVEEGQKEEKTAAEEEQESGSKEKGKDEKE